MGCNAARAGSKCDSKRHSTCGIVSQLTSPQKAECARTTKHADQQMRAVHYDKAIVTVMTFDRGSHQHL